MELGRCTNLLRLSLEGFRQREESSLRSLRPPRLSQSIHFLEPYTCEVPRRRLGRTSENAVKRNFAVLAFHALRRIEASPRPGSWTSS